MAKSIDKVLQAALMKLLRPLIQILLRNGVPFGTFSDLAKRIYVDVARTESGIPGKKQTVSRLSVITGLSRKEIGRIKKLPPVRETGETERYNRAARVIGGWIQDKRFLDSKGNPNVLPLDGPRTSFADLVKQYSGDVPARAILDELLRTGTVERTAAHYVRLLTHAYIPRTDEAGMLSILGTDVKDLIATIDHNLRASKTEDPKRFFQRKVSYDNLPMEVLPKLRSRTQTQAQNFLEAMNRWLSAHDRDINPDVAGTGRKRAGIGIYYFEEDFEDGGHS